MSTFIALLSTSVYAPARLLKGPGGGTSQSWRATTTWRILNLFISVENAMSPLFIKINRSSREAPEGCCFLVLARQLCEKMRFFDKIQQCCKTALFPHFWAMSTTKKGQKGPKYAKFAHIGEVVYSKGMDVHCEAQMRCWYGNLWKEKWVHETIQNIVKNPVNGCNQR
jgi:hypothetical protein